MSDATIDIPPVRDADGAARTGAESGPPPVNIRVSVPILRWRFYFAIMSGRERRDAARLSSERSRHPLRTPGNMLFVVAGAMLVYLIALGVLLIDGAAL